MVDKKRPVQEEGFRRRITRNSRRRDGRAKR
jgi:hypothetical protein